LSIGKFELGTTPTVRLIEASSVGGYAQCAPSLPKAESSRNGAGSLAGCG
jgi:hypothetical protein